jgi:hypothetical protein
VASNSIDEVGHGADLSDARVNGTLVSLAVAAPLRLRRALWASYLSIAAVIFGLVPRW